MRDIAKRAGMLAGSMYYHFPSKNDLIAAVYEAGVPRSAPRSTRRWRRRAGRGHDVEAACAAHLDSLLADAAHAAVMTADLGQLDSRLKRRLVTLRDGYEKRFVEVVEALPLPAGTDRSLWRCSSWARSTGPAPGTGPAPKSPAEIAKAHGDGAALMVRQVAGRRTAAVAVGIAHDEGACTPRLLPASQVVEVDAAAWYLQEQLLDLGALATVIEAASRSSRSRGCRRHRPARTPCGG
jgi:AcrR family transcriptional regulator